MTHSIPLPSQHLAQPEADRRKQLVPFWIKAVGWFFIGLSVVVTLLFVVSVLGRFSHNYALLHWHYEGSAIAFIPVAILAWCLISAICAYGLLWGKPWGLKACLVHGYLSLAITILSMLSGPGFINISLEIFIYPFYLRRLHKMLSHW